MRKQEKVLVAPAETGKDPMTDRVIEAAGRCFVQLGFKKTTIEDIAAESGVSRATIFRRFGKGEGILVELLRRASCPYVDQALALLAGPGPLRKRLENSTTYAAMEMPRNPWLEAVLDEGPSEWALKLIPLVVIDRLEPALRAALAGAEASGELRPGYRFEELSDWFLREFMLLVRDGPWEEEALRQRIRRYMMPVVLLDEPQRQSRAKNKPEDHLDRIESRLIELHQLVTCVISGSGPKPLPDTSQEVVSRTAAKKRPPPKSPKKKNT